MQHKIIFIDVDGPLAWGTWMDGRVTLNEQGKTFTIPYPWVEEECQALKIIVDQTKAKLVLSSDWRKHYSFIQMRRIFSYYGINEWDLIDTTTHQDLWHKMSRPSIDWERASEIAKWVKDNQIKNWIAIDDLNLANEFKWMRPRIPMWRHIWVDGDHGDGGRLRDKVDECISKLNR
jgi:hypothetical protein